MSIVNLHPNVGKQVQSKIIIAANSVVEIIMIKIMISGIYVAHLISHRTFQCVSLLLRYQENHHNHFTSTRLQLAKCEPYWHLDCNIFPRPIPPLYTQVNEAILRSETLALNSILLLKTVVETVCLIGDISHCLYHRNEQSKRLCSKVIKCRRW